MRLRKVVFGIGCMSILLAGCSSGAEAEKTLEEVKALEWSEIEAMAEGTTVNFYGWGGDEKVNTYLDVIVATQLKELHGITFNRIGMNIDEVLTRMLAEKESSDTGSVDIVWINGENFYTARNNGLLAGDFLEVLPNSQNLDMSDESILYDFGVSVDGEEAPWGRAQFVFFGDDSAGDFPKNPDQLKQWIMENPGRFTYPAPPDFTGSAFVRNLMVQMIDSKQLQNPDLSKEEVKEIIEPVIKYLVEIKPYLWRAGESYPADFAQLSNMYADGEVDFGMTYTVDGVRKSVSDGLYPENTKAFTFEKGSIGNTHFLTIPQKASNIAGALVSINELLSVDLQEQKADGDNWGDLSVLSQDTLLEEQAQNVESMEEIGSAFPEYHAALTSLIDEIWMEEVLE